MVDAPHDQHVKSGESALFAARLEPCMPLPDVQWYRRVTPSPCSTGSAAFTLDHGGSDDLMALDDDDTKYQLRLAVDGQASLKVTGVTLDDAGVYVMRAQSSAGVVEVSAVLTVHDGQFACVACH